MTIGFIFWFIMLVWLVFGIYTNREAVGPWLKQGDWIFFILFALLGIESFGWPIKA